MAKREDDRFSLKFDDLLLRLLRDYHDIDVNDATSFFAERAREMLECEPNITDKSRRPQTIFLNKSRGYPGKTHTLAHKYSKTGGHLRTYLNEIDTGGNRVYVLRGFYPDTHIPFKMTLVDWATGTRSNLTARGKVTIGLKEHHTAIGEKEITKYEEAVSESILLGTEIEEDKKIHYNYRDFRCMRPKGIQLYGEKRNNSKSSK